MQCNIVTNTGQFEGSQVWYTICQVKILADLQKYISALLTTLHLHMGFGGFVNMAVYTKLIFAFSTYHLEQYVNGA